jgi:PASTA domain/NPCBM/NEW2 domain
MAGRFGRIGKPNEGRQQHRDEATTGAPLDRRSRWRVVVRRFATTGGVVLLAAVGVFGGGVATGWELSARRDLSQPEPKVRTVAVPQYAAAGDVFMPDVRGMELSGARIALADAGIPEAAVAVTEQPWAGTDGVVIDQSPQFGAQKPAKITLGVSAPARIPAVMGRAQSEALSLLEGLGARVVLTRRFEPGVTAGTVLGVKPPARSAVPEEVTLTVAEAAGAVYLDQLPSVEGSCSSGTATVNGTEHQHVLQCSAGSDSPTEVAYLLNRIASTVTGVIGVPDDGQPTARVVVEVLADGRRVARVSAGYGKPEVLKAKVNRALRLTIRISAVSAGVQNDGSAVTAVLADIEVAGDPIGIDALTKTP